MTKQNSFSITIAKVGETLFQGEILSVSLPGAEGQLTVLAQHEPLIALLKKGMVEIMHIDGVTKERYEIASGIIEVSNSKAIILV
jgi:F-type H+-transporting ATPase subunit epsilon